MRDYLTVIENLLHLSQEGVEDGIGYINGLRTHPRKVKEMILALPEERRIIDI